MKKMLRILSVFTVMAALVFSACGNPAKQAEKSMLEWGKFCASDSHNETTLSVNGDKTYSLYVYDYETSAMKTYEGEWSHVLTFKNKYTVTHGVTDLVKTKESITFSVFKLDGYFDRGKQGYFIYKGYTGEIYCTSDEITESHFDQYKEKGGRIEIPGVDLRGVSED